MIETDVEIRKDLIKQLKERGTSQAHYESLVDDYIKFWNVKEELLADINERGVNIEYTNTAGHQAWKRNDSVSEVVKVQNQMLKILGDLGISGSHVGGETFEAKL